MQLHHLTLSAIGPFETEFHIDFGALGASGLFLLEGPTGSGKSTIIDSIVYALYGKVASAESSDDRMRSDHAADTQESIVDLVFETTHGIFRVVRQPERWRPKLRGEGLTREQANVTLYRLSVPELESINSAYETGADHEGINALGVGDVRTTRLDEAGAEIVRAIGLDRSQFAQTIVLPQGEFAKFLRAEPEHRRALLQKVFGTEIFERAQTELAAMRVEASKAIAAGDGARRDAVRAFTQAVENSELTPEELVALGDSELEEGIAQEVARLSVAETAATDAELAAITLETEAQEAYRAAQQRVTLHQQRAALEQEKLVLQDQQEANQKAEITYAQAIRASYVLPAIEAQRIAQEEQNEALNSFVSSVDSAQKFAELGAVQGDLQAASTSTLHVFARTFRDNRSALVDQRDQAQHMLGQLQQIERLERDLPNRRKAVEALRSKAADLAAEAEQIQKALELRPAGLAELTEQRDERTREASSLATLDLEIARLREHIGQHDAADAAEKKVATSQNAVDLAVVTASNESDREHELRRSWLSQLASIVARELEPGEPCQVCGSIEHPSPAQPDPQAATEEQVERAEAIRKRAEAALATARASLAAALERRDVVREQLGDTTRETTQGELTAAQEKRARAQEAAAAAQQLNVTILNHRTETERLVARDKTTAEQIAATRIRIEEADSSIERDSATVSSTLEKYSSDITEFDDASEPVTASALGEFLNSRAAAIAHLLRSLDALNSAQENAATRSTELTNALAEHGFASADEANAVALPLAERNALNAKITSFTQRWVTVNTQLDSPQYADLPRELDVDLDQLRTLNSDAQVKARQATHLANTAKNRHREAEFRAREITRVVDSLREQRAKVAPIIRMADIANGNSTDNAKRITLATYVLMRRFEDVVAAANTRLSALSDGRFELARSDEKEDVRSRKTGLALKVIDHETDKARDPRTLSGGETFNASLSLALGLADVVTGEAGGVELGTLFIDEGFGTLDPDALERVITVLSDLRDGGRTVGVVSHVETLKQSIPDGISVRHLPTGASTLSVRA